VGARYAMKPDKAKLALVFILYFVGAKLGVALTVMPEGIAIIWLPNSVVLAALIRFNGARYPAIAALAMAAELAADWPNFTAIESLLFGLVNVGEATLAYALLRRWGFDPRFVSPADLAKFVVAGPLAGAILAALLGAAIYSFFRGSQTSYAEFVRIWWFGDGLGLLILTPVLLAFPPFGGDPSAPPLTLTRADAVIWAAAAIALVLFWILSDGHDFRIHFGPVLLLPFVLYAAARYPHRWVAAWVAMATTALAAAMTHGRNPFGTPSPSEAVIEAQEFIFIMSLMALGLASLLSQVRARSRELESANRMLHALNDDLEARVQQRTADLSKANQQLATLAGIDPLTDLYNRRGWFEIAQREVARARRGGHGLALMMIDLDHFKAINDHYGHLAGDEALKRCASLLRKAVRPGDTCGRYGGEEFVVVTPEADFAGASALAKRIVDVVHDESIPSPEGMFNVTVSIGVTILAREDTGLDEVMRRADAALYEAKSAGRNCFVAIAPNPEWKRASPK